MKRKAKKYNLYQRVEHIRKGMGVFLVFALLILGIILNAVFPHRYFYFDQLLLLTMLSIEIAVVKAIGRRICSIKESISVEQETEALGAISKIERAEKSPRLYIILCTAVPLYLGTLHLLGSAENTLTGWYGILLGSLVFIIGILAYYRYVAFALFVYDLRKIRLTHYNFYMPALTEWFVQIAETLSFIDKWFFVLGMMYTTLFAIIMPPGSVVFQNGIYISTKYKALFTITWGGVFIFFIFAFPIFTVLFRSFLKRLIIKCKGWSIRQLELRIRAVENYDNDAGMTLIEKYITLIKTIDDSSDYPLRYRRTVFDGAFAILLSVGTIVSPYLSLLEHALFKGNP